MVPPGLVDRPSLRVIDQYYRDGSVYLLNSGPSVFIFDPFPRSGCLA